MKMMRLTALVGILVVLFLGQSARAEPLPPFTPAFTETIDEAAPSDPFVLPSDDDCPVGSRCKALFEVSIPDGQPGFTFRELIPSALFTVGQDSIVPNGAIVGWASQTARMGPIGSCGTGSIVSVDRFLADATTDPATTTSSPSDLSSFDHWPSQLDGVRDDVLATNPGAALLARWVSVGGATNVLVFHLSDGSFLFVPISGDPTVPPTTQECGPYSLRVIGLGESMDNPDTPPDEGGIPLVTCIAAGTQTFQLFLDRNDTPPGDPIMLEDTVTCSPNTPADGGVSVPLNGGTDVLAGINVTFSEVTEGGSTTVITTTTGPPPPTGFNVVGLAELPLYFDINTDASYSGDLTVCVRYDETQVVGAEDDLKLMQRVDDDYVDTTTYVDTVNDIICGRTTQLSIFIVAEASAPPTLVAYWPFDEGSGTTVWDVSGYENHGTIGGATWVSGVSGSALNFDGVDDYVEVPDADSLSNSTITMDFWIKPARVDREQILVNKYYDMDSSRSEYLVKLGDALDNGEKVTLASIGVDSMQSGDVISNVGQWYHIVGIVSGCQSQIYVDGVLVAGGCLSPMSNTTTPLVIGRYAVSYHHQAFAGAVDEVKIYRGAVPPESACGTWSTGPSLNTARSVFGSAVAGGAIHVFGGLASGGSITLDDHEALAGGPSWSTEWAPSIPLAPMPTKRNQLVAQAVGGKIYAISGDKANVCCNFTDANEEYDPSTNTWTPRAPIPTPREVFAGAVLNGEIYAIGGSTPLEDAVERYTPPPTDTWQSVAPLNKPRGGLAAAAANGKVYAISGTTADGCDPSVEAYDPASNTWTFVAPMPKCRAVPMATEFNGKIYVFGGSGPDCPAPGACNDVFVYDPVANTWSEWPEPMPTPRQGGAAVVFGNAIYVIGGAVGGGFVPAVTVVEVFTPPCPGEAIAVPIDIKPGSDPNSINLGCHGVVPVAVLTTEDFDAATVDPTTVTFAGVAPKHWALEDVDGDGDIDMILHFKCQELDIDAGAEEACLAGSTYGGADIEGCDSVRIVPPDSPADSDGDGFADAIEVCLGTDLLDDCADTATPHDERGPDYGEPLSPWPPDFNDNGRTDIGDVVLIRNHWVPLGNAYGARYDLNANGRCDIGDVVILKTYWPPPIGNGPGTCTQP